MYEGISQDEQERIIKKQQERYKVSRDFQIAPTRECKRSLDNHHLIFKRDNFGFFVACKVTSMGDGTFVPFIQLNESFCLRFAVNLQNQYLTNFSNLSLEKDVEKKDHFLYYFTNRANNYVPPNALYLSQPVTGFDDSSVYEAGEIIIDSTVPANPKMFEAIEDNGPAPFNDENWKQIFDDLDPLPQFVTKIDRVVLRPRIFKHNVESVAKEVLTFLIYDYDGTHLKTLNFETVEPGTPLVECELKLSDLPSACYSLEVKDNAGNIHPELDLGFYMDDTLFNQGPFALIECFHKPEGSLEKYRWLDHNNDNRILAPNYTIHWKNRSTFWRYYYAKAPSFTSSQSDPII